MSSKQDKATTERHAKMLRELLKKPENKFCADCKRNDPRWASWNLGVFLCIRCSGIHRSMGTHISKVKSVDLDVWTPEQMASISKWGNRLANLYWEAHLKPGHIPPDHKMDSFIRSKYESRRWARDGPPPSDPSTLDDGAASAPPPPAPQPIPPPVQHQTSQQRPTHHSASSSSSLRGQVTNRQPQPHQLLSTTVAGRHASQQQQQPTQAPPPPQQPASQPAASPVNNELFTLDFHNPVPPSAPAAPKKDVKQDILSLFSAAPAAATQPAYPATAPPYGQFGAQPQAQAQNVWGQFGGAPQQQQQQQQQPATQSMMGNAGIGMWGASSGWNPAPAAAPSSNLWGASSPAQPQVQSQQAFFNTNDIWASPAASNGAAGGGDLFGGSASGAQQKKDDVFGDIWGGFK
ncbi:hypothetical protein C8Q75DRAFT_792381 [Abortiporus biennis]|nr:hypothetical protein C8Q75DRAFT_792381 [Abortiporus biennis]